MADWEKTLIVLLLIFVIIMIIRNERMSKCAAKQPSYPREREREGMESHANSDSGQGVANTEFKERAQELTKANYGDYNQLIQAMALEPEVFESQDEYNAGMNSFSSGASQQSERTDPNDINLRLGIRPIYYDVDVGENSRVVPSEHGDQVGSRERVKWEF